MIVTRFEAWYLTGLMMALWALMPATMLWDWDEPLYARTAIEMFEAGNLMLPKFNGEIFAHKPPFGYWAMGLGAQIFGETEFATRFFSAPALALSAWLIGRSGTLLFGEEVGKTAMVIASTGLMGLYLGAAAMMDAYLLAGYTLAVWVILKVFVEGRVSFGLLALFALGCLETMLVKGPVGPVLIGGMALGAFVFLPRGERPGWTVFFWLVAAGFIAFCGFLMWFLSANTASGGALLSEGVGVHIIGRLLQPMEGHGGQGLAGFLIFLPVYIPVIFLSMIPWSAYFPGAIRHVFTGMERRNRVLILAWFLPIFIVFSIVATKLPHYIFPATAPLAVAISAWLDRRPKSRNLGGRSLTAGLYLLMAFGLLWMAITFQGVLCGPLVGLAAVGVMGLGGLVFYTASDRVSILALALASLAVMQLFFWGGLREIESLAKVSRLLGQVIQAEVPEDAAVLMSGYKEPSLAFYASRPVGNPIRLVGQAELVEVVKEIEAGFIVLTRDRRNNLETAMPETRFDVLADAAAWNFNKNGIRQSVFLLKWVGSSE